MRSYSIDESSEQYDEYPYWLWYHDKAPWPEGSA